MMWRRGSTQLLAATGERLLIVDINPQVPVKEIEYPVSDFEIIAWHQSLHGNDQFLYDGTNEDFAIHINLNSCISQRISIPQQMSLATNAYWFAPSLRFLDRNYQLFGWNGKRVEQIVNGSDALTTWHKWSNTVIKEYSIVKMDVFHKGAYVIGQQKVGYLSFSGNHDHLVAETRSVNDVCKFESTIFYSLHSEIVAHEVGRTRTILQVPRHEICLAIDGVSIDAHSYLACLMASKDQTKDILSRIDLYEVFDLDV